VRLVNVKIGTQLRLGLGLIILFVIILGVESFRQNEFLGHRSYCRMSNHSQLTGRAQPQTDVCQNGTTCSAVLAADEQEIRGPHP